MAYNVKAMANTSKILASVLLAATFGLAAAQLDVHPVYSGGMKEIGFYVPQRLNLTKDVPAGLIKTPHLTDPLYGTIDMNGKKFIVVVNHPLSGGSELYVDTNGNGDLTDDKPTEWKPAPYQDRAGDKLTRYMGSAGILCGYGDGKTPLTIGCYIFDSNDADRAQLKNTLLYYSDYALVGTATLGGKPYHVVLADTRCTGSFTPSGADSGNGIAPVEFMIDVNGNGKIDPRGEMYDASKPFNIAGTTYELHFSDQANAMPTVETSAKTVAEILPPPDLSAGHKCISFTAKDTSGKTVHFPEDFKGKVVMLDFWATWCGPCMGEVPNVVKTYNKLHDQGFEILGISLDNTDTIKNLVPVTKQKGMTWDQIADGKYWNAEVAQTYGVEAIPQAYIIDGDTGMILAQGDEIRGDQLLPAVQKALAAKGKASGGR